MSRGFLPANPLLWTVDGPLGNYPDPIVRSVASTITKKNRKFWCYNEKTRVPDTFQFGAISDATAFRACRFFNKFRVFNSPEYSDSPRLHHIKSLVINRLRRFLYPCVPEA